MNGKFQTYLFEYSHAGASWGVRIEAESPEDAKARLQRIAHARYQGEVVAVVPGVVATPARLFVAARNLGHRIKELFTR